MKRTRISIALLALTFLGTSCQKDSETENVSTPTALVSQMQDLQIPANFNYETTEQIELDFNYDNAPLSGKYKITIHDQFPSAAAPILFTGFISNNETLNQTISLPASVRQLYVVNHAPDGSSFVTILPKSNNVNHTFYKNGKNKMMKGNDPGPSDCSSGCDQTIAFSNGNYTLKDKKDVYCITGTYSGGSINIQNEAIVRLCGTGSISTINITKGTLQVINGADVTITNLNYNSDKKNEFVVYQGASLTITNTFSPNADFENYGTLKVGALNLNSNSDFENVGSFEVTSNSPTTINGEVDNVGSFTTNGNLTINGGAKFKNECTASINGDLQVNNDFETKYGAYTNVTGKITINGSGELKTKDGSLVTANELHLNGEIDGDGSTSMVKIAAATSANWGSKVKDAVQLCLANGQTKTGNWNFTGGATESCSLVIPITSCNPVGNGVAQPIADADGDGVSDDIDAYPSDPARAANSYYPNESTYGTLAFEDLWPAFGDFDFNDLVVDYRYQQVLDANNKVVDLKAKFVTRAIGGALKNGFGIQLNVNNSAVSSVSGTRYFNSLVSTNGNGTESGQTKATVIIYDDASEIITNTTGAAFVNTLSANPTLDNDTTDITINFGSPQTAGDLGDAPYNPFIIVDQTRGREVHLAGNEPTDLADATLFGTINDDTDPNNADDTYKSANNLPWAINVTTGFQYPEEKIDIVQTYNYFALWAQSGGVSYPDWSSDQAGYITTSNLYQGAN